jgi:FKBP-type peptidyl-prolyl cis-trans isomerase (trigger factor)
MPKSLLDAEIKRLNEDIEKKATQAKTTANEYITTQLGYKNKTDFDKILVQSAEKNLHLIIGIEKIIDELKIEVSADELNKHLEKLARVYGSSIDDIKKRLNNNLDGIETFLLQEKMFDKLIEINKNNK